MEDESMYVRQTTGISRVALWQNTFMWELENAAFCPKRCGDAMVSPIFASGPREELKWRLELLPRGITSDLTDYSAVFLKLLSSTSGSTFARYEISLWSDGEKRRSMSRADLFHPTSRLGWTAFVKSAVFFSECQRSKVVSLHCDISAAEQVSYSSVDLNTVSFIAPYQPTAEPMLALLDSGRFSDIAIMSSEGEEFKVHAAILAAHSAKCSTLFQQWNLTKHRKNLILDMKTFESSTVRQMLAFIYAGKLPNFTDIHTAEDLLAASHELGIESLKRLCEQVLEAKITINHVANVLLLADMHCASRLKQKCLSFVRENVARVLDTPSWKSLACQKPNIVADLTTEIALVLSADT